MFVCAGDIEQFDFATPVGIGLVNSAINLTKICLLNPPEFLLFVGTAGSYGGHEIFDIVESRSGANIETGFFTHGAYTPIDNVISSSDNVSRETIVNSSNYITTDPTLSPHYLTHNISLENMEFFSVMRVGQEFGIPTGGIFIVTNYCDGDAHATFLANHAEAKKRLHEYIMGRFPNGK
jgi:nucleoside phosphorylase